MKPKDLRFPFTWEERRPLFERGVFYVPDYYSDHDRSALPAWEKIFGNTNPVYIEYCSGNGEWIAMKAEQYPDINWVAVEKRFKRVKKIWSKKENSALSNLLIVRGAAEIFTEHYVDDKVASKIFINFPDPWPKDRHAKHRLFQEPFVKEMARISKDEGTVTLVTDHADYSMWASKAMKGIWQPRTTTPEILNSMTGYGPSYFARLWQDLGREIRYMEFSKCM